MVDRKRDLRTDRLRHRPLQRVGAARAWIRADHLSPDTRGDGPHSAHRHFLGGYPRREGQHEPADERRHAAARPSPSSPCGCPLALARHGGGGRHGHRGRLRDGPILLVLGAGSMAAHTSARSRAPHRPSPCWPPPSARFYLRCASLAPGPTPPPFYVLALSSASSPSPPGRSACLRLLDARLSAAPGGISSLLSN